METVYKAFGGKPGLVRAMVSKGLEGSGAVPAERRSDEMQASEHDPRAIIRNWTRLATEVAPRTAPIVLLIRSAADTDPEMADLLLEVDDLRLRRMEKNAHTLFERGDLRPEITLEQARDVLWTTSSPELYELLVLRRGWSVDRFAAFQADLMIAALLPPQAPTSDRNVPGASEPVLTRMDDAPRTAVLATRSTSPSRCGHRHRPRAEWPNRPGKTRRHHGAMAMRPSDDQPGSAMSWRMTCSEVMQSPSQASSTRADETAATGKGWGCGPSSRRGWGWGCDPSSRRLPSGWRPVACTP